MSIRAQRRSELRQALLALLQRQTAGSRLPSERELSERFGVARETLRRMLDELEEEGVVQRKHGAGTFLAGQTQAKPFQLISFSEDMRERGLSPSSKLLGTQLIAAGAKLAQTLKLSPGAQLHEIRRLRLANDQPMALETVYLVRDRLPGFDPGVIASGSLYSHLEKDCGVMLVSARQQMQATVLSEDEARLLDVAPFSPSLLIERVVTTGNGDIVEYGKSLYRADRYCFEIEVLRPGLHAEPRADEEDVA
ncbi:GntR family transcriptional regulator [Chitinimonas sp. BJYL2]|uniref:GntR family transcriptional regulator n=1 Tax=Chitinimonas sp. BJYL2 TaxID=2976696 RepID=UPI0022B33DF8|nr:GntR family transcriptional regulator [Chitinimonas sp. BJYL2]